MLSRFDFFLLGTARPCVFLVGEGLLFPIDETRFSHLFSVTIESVFYNCY